ncbi:MAG TPA: RNA polymerase sigma factor [Solirubrobacteraceae bacterium]|nr:RNA polymerase sigma factor [Solirubrobacteraceae bacterium]
MHLPPFQALLDAHGREVHRFLVATVGRVDADDCYQETWLAVLRAYPRLRDDSNLRGWVMRIAHNKAIDHLRSRRRAPLPVEELGEAAGALDGVALPDRELWGRVGRLPVKQRAAVALRFLADAGYGEISAAMGTSEDAARRNVHEGLKRLRKELAA